MCLFSTCHRPSVTTNLAVMSIAVSILMFQWITAFLFIITKVQAFILVSSIVLACGCTGFVVFICKFNRMIQIFIRTESQILLDKPYFHPLDENLENN